MELAILNFVYFYNSHLWETGSRYGVLSKFEESKPGFVTGIIKGTYEHNGNFLWDIRCDSQELIYQLRIKIEDHNERYEKFGFDGIGSSQIEPDSVIKDVSRCRNWELCELVNDYSNILDSESNEYVMEKLFIKQYIDDFNKYINENF